MFNPRQKRLLALDGGGILGVITLGALRRIEGDLRLHTGRTNLRLRDFFDYFAGTSTGAIIAAGLALGKSVDEIERIYVEEGEDIFDRRGLIERVTRGLRSKYRHEKLTQRLKEEFTDRTIAELQAEGHLPAGKHLLVVTRNAETDSPWPISSHPAAKYNDTARADCNLNIPLWQLVRASSAAPTYFVPERLQWDLRDPDKTFLFEDGGATPYNNPALLCFRMATMPLHGCNWATGEDRMMVVSVGTSYAYRTLRTPHASGENLLATAASIPGELMRGMALENDINCRTFGRCVAGPVIDRELGDMITAPGKTTDRLFSYARYDIETSPDALQAMGLGHIRPEDLRMDNVAAVPEMQLVGQKLGESVDLPSHFPEFLR